MSLSKTAKLMVGCVEIFLSGKNFARGRQIKRKLGLPSQQASRILKHLDNWQPYTINKQNTLYHRVRPRPKRIVARARLRIGQESVSFVVESR
jgi:hypothetical protein